MKISTTLRSLVAGLGLAAVSMSPAHATLINTWDYYLEAGFSQYDPAASVTASGTSGLFLNDPTKLEWGGGTSGPSSLVLNPQGGDPTTPTNPNPLSGQVNTSTGPLIWANGTQIAHNNNPITGTDLDNATILDQFNLDAFAPPPAGQNVNRNPSFLIDFQETTNQPITNPPCVAPDPAGCMDIFVLDLVSSSGVIGLYDPTTLIIDQFVVEDYLYQVLLRTDPNPAFAQLGLLTNDQCTAAGALPGCIGMLTKEAQSNIAQLQFAVNATQIPEPALLALFGVGLLGLGFARRRKQG